MNIVYLGYKCFAHAQKWHHRLGYPTNTTCCWPQMPRSWDPKIANGAKSNQLVLLACWFLRDNWALIIYNPKWWLECCPTFWIQWSTALLNQASHFCSTYSTTGHLWRLAGPPTRSTTVLYGVSYLTNFKWKIFDIQYTYLICQKNAKSRRIDDRLPPPMFKWF